MMDMNSKITQFIAKVLAVLAVIGLVAASFATFTPSAGAQTIDDLEAKLRALQAQLAQLKSQEVLTDDLYLPTQAVLVPGKDNDYAVFWNSVEITAVKKDILIPVEPDAAFVYEIRDKKGHLIEKSTALSLAITSDAEREGNYFRIKKGEVANVRLHARFDPLPSDEAKAYRLHILAFNYANRAGAESRAWELKSLYTYRTDAVFIED